jgi:hypothetical protein
LTIVNQAGLIISAKVQYQYSGIAYSRRSEKILINQKYDFILPDGASGIFVQISSGKVLYESTFDRNSQICLKVTGTLFSSKVEKC